MCLLVDSDPAEHAKRRSMIAKRYRKNEMASVLGIITSHLEQWVQSERWNGEVDLGLACRALEADIICEPDMTPRRAVVIGVADFSFGVPIEAIGEWSSGRQSIPVEANDEKAKWLVFVSQ